LLLLLRLRVACLSLRSLAVLIPRFCLRLVRVRGRLFVRVLPLVALSGCLRLLLSVRFFDFLAPFFAGLFVTHSQEQKRN
jgi:hypothetical protein